MVQSHGRTTHSSRVAPAEADEKYEEEGEEEEYAQMALQQLEQQQEWLQEKPSP